MEEVKLLFSGKDLCWTKIILDNGTDILYNDQEVSEELNTFFQTATISMEVEEIHTS